MLTVSCRLWTYLQICATLPIPLSRALDLVQQHPRVRFTNLDLHSPEVASAVRASDAQADKWCALSPSHVLYLFDS